MNYMKFIKTFIILIGIVSLIAVVLTISGIIIIKNTDIKALLEKEIETSLGIKVTIDSIEFSPLLAHIGAKGVTIHSPKGFNQEELAYLSYIHILLDPLEIILRSKPNIYVCALDLKRLNIVKNNQGLINIEQLIPQKNLSADKKDNTPFYFDVLILSVGEVNYTDYTQKPIKTHNYKIDLKNATFYWLKNEQDVTRLIISKAIANTDIGKLINLKIIPAMSQVGTTVTEAW